MPLLLGVNIDHVATLRQARYALLADSPNAEPCPVAASLAAQAAGADSITVHVRADRRHMQERDVFKIKEACTIPINLEMGNTPEMLEIALKLQPKFVCLVPETREEVTTEGGLDVLNNEESLTTTVAKLQANGIKVSLFIDPELDHIEASKRIGAEMIELHTGCFANAVGDTADQKSAEIKRLITAAELAHQHGIQVNAGHGINYDNLEELFVVPHLVELNVGHSIVARSVFSGFENAVKDIISLMQKY